MNIADSPALHLGAGVVAGLAGTTVTAPVTRQHFLVTVAQLAESLQLDHKQMVGCTCRFVAPGS